MRNVILLASLFTSSVLACDLKVESAWIREAPSSAKSLAGYALLSNAGSKPLTVVSASSKQFAKVEMHETAMENGIAKMRAIEKLEIAANAKVEFGPAGKHFMMIEPQSPLRGGDVVSVTLKDAANCETAVQFKVTSAAVSSSSSQMMDHSKMDHSMHH